MLHFRNVLGGMGELEAYPFAGRPAGREATPLMTVTSGHVGVHRTIAEPCRPRPRDDFARPEFPRHGHPHSEDYFGAAGVLLPDPVGPVEPPLAGAMDPLAPPPLMPGFVSFIEGLV
jgi:hypothetical protein